VKQLLDHQVGAGLHTVVWDGTNERGEAVASGVYFCRLVAGERAETQRMTLVR
jgi:flagellar hook assembly protein FlgD